MIQEKGPFNILITGATGFVGRILVECLQKSGHIITGTGIETPCHDFPFEYYQVKDLAEENRWNSILTGQQIVIHLAALVHQMNPGQSLDGEFERINVGGTKRLAEASMKAGIKRFIYLSSVKAMGEKTLGDELWNELTPSKPLDAYGRSKLHAEQILLEMNKHIGFPVVIFRPPLMYGPGVKANMASLMKIVNSSFPLPLDGIKNHRSLLSVKNLASAIELACSHEKAPGNIFLIADGEPISTSEMIRKMAKAAKRRVLLFKIPNFIWSFLSFFPWVGSRVDRLTQSLALDISKIKSILNWKPPFDLDSSLAETFDALRATSKNRGNST